MALAEFLRDFLPGQGIGFASLHKDDLFIQKFFKVFFILNFFLGFCFEESQQNNNAGDDLIQ